MGTSPRVRGKLGLCYESFQCVGYIPACAGETYLRQSERWCRTVHPRVCGGNEDPAPVHHPPRGTSPRVRGKHWLKPSLLQASRYIPACAGETEVRCLQTEPGWVHPRVCGGNRANVYLGLFVIGTSPRVRGKPSGNSGSASFVRYIPACAGETIRPCPRATMRRVHPRVCGGNHSEPLPTISLHGTSPRVRGKPVPIYGFSFRLGYIPACAGETHASVLPAFTQTVHPRVCGGNDEEAAVRVHADGTSPRVRGKPLLTVAQVREVGYIPACAGETSPPPVLYYLLMGYIPACAGETHRGTIPKGAIWGTSPRVRGKHHAGNRSRPKRRYIPACAGETSDRSCRCSSGTVHPRVCGGNRCRK